MSGTLRDCLTLTLALLRARAAEEDGNATLAASYRREAAGATGGLLRQLLALPSREASPSDAPVAVEDLARRAVAATCAVDLSQVDIAGVARDATCYTLEATVTHRQGATVAYTLRVALDGRVFGLEYRGVLRLWTPEPGRNAAEIPGNAGETTPSGSG